MNDSIAIHGHDIIELVFNSPQGIPLSRLNDIIRERYGRLVTFHTCSASGMNLDELLQFLAVRDKVKVVDNMVYPGSAPACEH